MKMNFNIPSVYYNKDILTEEYFNYVQSELDSGMIPKGIKDKLNDITKDNIFDIQKYRNILRVFHTDYAKTYAENLYPKLSPDDQKEKEDEIRSYLDEATKKILEYNNLYSELANGKKVERKAGYREIAELIADNYDNKSVCNYYIREMQTQGIDMSKVVYQVYNVLSERENQGVKEEKRWSLKSIFGKKKTTPENDLLEKYNTFFQLYLGAEDDPYRVIKSVSEFRNCGNSTIFFVVMDETDRALKAKGNDIFNGPAQNFFGQIWLDAVRSGLISKEDHILQFCDVLKNDSLRMELISILEYRAAKESDVKKMIPNVNNKLIELGGYGREFLQRVLDQDVDQKYTPEELKNIVNNATFNSTKTDKYGDLDRLALISHLEQTGKKKDYVLDVIWELVRKGGYGATFLKKAIYDYQWNGNNHETIIYRASLTADESKEFLKFPMGTATRIHLLDNIAAEKPEDARALYDGIKGDLTSMERIKFDARYLPKPAKPIFDFNKGKGKSKGKNQTAHTDPNDDISQYT